METNKRYAIKVETQKEATDCMWFTIILPYEDLTYYEINLYTIISYQEAKDKWLLEKNTILLDSTERSEPNNNEQLIEEIKDKIQHEIDRRKDDNWDDYDKWIKEWLMIAKTVCKEILKKHLSK